MKGRQNDPSIHLMRYSWAQTFIDELSARNACIMPMAARVKLPTTVDDPSLLIAKRPIFRFVGQSAAVQSLPLLGLDAARRASASRHGRSLIAADADAKALCGNLRSFIRLIRTQANNIPVGLEVTGRGAYLWHLGMSPESELADAAAQMELLLAGLCIEKVKSCLGERWQPRRLELQSARVPPAQQAEFPQTRIVPRSTMLKVWFSLGELSRIVPASQTGPMREIEPVPHDLRRTLQAALISAFTDAMENPVTLEMAAEMAGANARSLQRHLARAGSTFRDVMGDALVVSASSHLQDPNASVTEVAAIHGYSAPTHFIRAYKRFSGASPGQYQKMAAQRSI